LVVERDVCVTKAARKRNCTARALHADAIATSKFTGHLKTEGKQHVTTAALAAQCMGSARLPAHPIAAHSLASDISIIRTLPAPSTGGRHHYTTSSPPPLPKSPLPCPDRLLTPTNTQPVTCLLYIIVPGLFGKCQQSQHHFLSRNSTPLTTHPKQGHHTGEALLNAPCSSLHSSAAGSAPPAAPSQRQRLVPTAAWLPVCPESSSWWYIA
jgi:hypothetical protein